MTQTESTVSLLAKNYVRMLAAEDNAEIAQELADEEERREDDKRISAAIEKLEALTREELDRDAGLRPALTKKGQEAFNERVEDCFEGLRVGHARYVIRVVKQRVLGIKMDDEERDEDHPLANSRIQRKLT